MLENYEKLRQEQLNFIEEYYKKSVEPKGKFIQFWIGTNQVCYLSIDDLVSFANKYNLTFNYGHLIDAICFKSINITATENVADKMRSTMCISKSVGTNAEITSKNMSIVKKVKG